MACTGYMTCTNFARRAWHYSGTRHVSPQIFSYRVGKEMPATRLGGSSNGIAWALTDFNFPTRLVRNLSRERFAASAAKVT